MWEIFPLAIWLEILELNRNVQSKHPEESKLLQAAENSKSSCLTNSNQPVSPFYSAKTISDFGWLDLIVGACLPFNRANHPSFRSNVKHTPITLDTLKKYMSKLMKKLKLNSSLCNPKI